MKSIYVEYFVRPVNAFVTTERLVVYPRLVLVGFALFAVYYLTDFFAFTGETTRVLGADFLAFYTGARFYLEGMQASLFDYPAQQVFQHQLLPHDWEGLAMFINPPYAVLLYAPFGCENYAVAFLAWTLVGLGCFFLSLMIIKREWLGEFQFSSRSLLLYACSFLAVGFWLLSGQATGILFLLLTVSLNCLRKQREFLGGFTLGLLAFKPQIALCLALPLIFKLRWRALAGGFCSVSIWLALGVALFPQEMQQFWDIRSTVVGLITSSVFPIAGGHSIYVFCHLLLGELSADWANGLAEAISALLLVGLAVFWWRTPWRPGSVCWDRAVAGSMAIGLLLGIHLFTYDLTLLLIPFLLMLSSYGAELDYRLDRGPVFAWSVVIYVLVCIGRPLINLQLQATSDDGFNGIALQLTTLAIICWGVAALKQSTTH